MKSQNLKRHQNCMICFKFTAISLIKNGAKHISFSCLITKIKSIGTCCYPHTTIDLGSLVRRIILKIWFEPFFWKIFFLDFGGISKWDGMMQLSILRSAIGKNIFTMVKYQYHLDEIYFTSLQILHILHVFWFTML